MRSTTARLFTGPLLIAAVTAGLIVAPSPADAAVVSAVVHSSSNLKVRTSTSLSSVITGAVRNGQRVNVACVTPGQNVRGSLRTSNLWARIATGRYVPYAYLKAVRSISRCATPKAIPIQPKPTTGTAAYQVGTVRSTDGKVNLRSGPSAAFALKGSVLNGAKINLVCGVVGSAVAGTVRSTNQWNRTTTGIYISHAYTSVPTLKLCKNASTLPTTSPSVSRAQFIAAAVPGAQASWRAYGVPPSVTIAQAILESGWGASSLSSTHRNYFGIKCQNGKFGTIANGCYTYRTNECTAAGKCFVTTGVFRTYATMAHSVRDHGSFLKVNSRYKPAFVHTRSANNFIWAVWKAGYATDPNYYTKVTGVMTANSLYQYDTWK